MKTIYKNGFILYFTGVILGLFSALFYGSGEWYWWLGLIGLSIAFYLCRMSGYINRQYEFNKDRDKSILDYAERNRK